MAKWNAAKTWVYGWVGQQKRGDTLVMMMVCKQMFECVSFFLQKFYWEEEFALTLRQTHVIYQFKIFHNKNKKKCARSHLIHK